MTEADNVGYKRTKRGENKMPNDLYDIEYAPQTLNTSKVIDYFTAKVDEKRDKEATFNKDKEELEKKNKDKLTATTVRKIEKLQEEIEQLENIIQELSDDLSSVEEILETYYENNTLKDEYYDRLDENLIYHFEKGLLRQYKSDDILLRKNEVIKILDAMRKEVSWE